MNNSDIMKLNIEDVLPDKNNPRQDFDEEPLARLETSVKKLGIRNPLLVESLPNGKYLIVDGERRYRTAIKLKLKTVPARLQEPTDAKERLIIRFNLQEVHQSWTPLDKAIAVGELSKLTDWSLKELAEALGMAKTSVSNLLMINNLSSRTIARMKKIASARTISKLARVLGKIDDKDKEAAEEAFVKSIEFGKINNDREANKYMVAIQSTKLPQLIKLSKEKKYFADDALKDAKEEHVWIERTLYNQLMTTRSVARKVLAFIKKNPEAKKRFSDRCTDLLSGTAVVVERLRKAL